MTTYHNVITLKAKVESVDIDSGEVTLAFETRPLTETEQTVLDDLFPTFRDKVEYLLRKESVLASIKE